MHVELYVTFKDSVVVLKVDFAHIYVHYVGKVLRNVVNYAYAVESPYLYAGKEGEHCVLCPLCGYYSLSIFCCKFVCCLAALLVYHQFSVVVYEAYYLVSRYWAAALCNAVGEALSLCILLQFVGALLVYLYIYQRSNALFLCCCRAKVVVGKGFIGKIILIVFSEKYVPIFYKLLLGVHL